MTKTITIVGPTGAGKTTIGRALAQRLGFSFVDSDHEIEISTGVSIPTIFEYEGEVGFREREEKVIDKLTLQGNSVIATGGGAIKNPETCKRIQARSLVIYLKVSVEEQLRRTQKDKNRPLLQAEDPATILKNMAVERTPLYEKIADYTFDTDNKTAQQVIHSILSVLEQNSEAT